MTATWRDTFEVEQTGLDIPSSGRSQRRSMTKCGTDTPSDTPICGHGDFCERVVGHAANHSSQPSTCNRPVGHDGDHMILFTKDYRVLARWSDAEKA